MIDSLVKDLEKQANVLRVLKEKYPDLSIETNRWGRKKFYSGKVNTEATEFTTYHSCGCCPDAVLLASPYIREVIDGEAHFIYSNPSSFVIGELSEGGYRIYPNFEEALKKYGISETLIKTITDRYKNDD